MELFDRIRGLLEGKDAPVAQTVTVQLTAAAPGTAMTVAALGLPNVEPIIARETGEDPDHDPNVAWLIDKPKDGKALWTRLVSEFPTTGLWPVVADGLDGDINRPWRGCDVSAVLRSWEDRFGAVLIPLGLASLTLHVDAPPTGENATRAAHEWYAFCPDSIDQGVGSMEALTEAVHDHTWWFWWD